MNRTKILDSISLISLTKETEEHHQKLKRNLEGSIMNRIIIIDKCYPSCPNLGKAMFDEAGNFIGHECRATEKPIPREFTQAIPGTFPNFCPLKELPKKKGTSAAAAIHLSYETNKRADLCLQYNLGFNDCIDTIIEQEN